MDDRFPFPAPAWQQELARAYSRPEDLLAALGLDPATPALDYARLREFPLRVPRGFAETLRTLTADPSIEEVILSGGDPLALTDDKLAAFVAGLEAIPHLRRLRLHTRVPVVLPERVDAALLGWLGATKLQKTRLQT